MNPISEFDLMLIGTDKSQENIHNDNMFHLDWSLAEWIWSTSRRFPLQKIIVTSQPKCLFYRDTG